MSELTIEGTTVAQNDTITLTVEMAGEQKQTPAFDIAWTNGERREAGVEFNGDTYGKLIDSPTEAGWRFMTTRSADDVSVPVVAVEVA